MHCNSTYPMEDEDANLNCILTQGKFKCDVGYSGHENPAKGHLAAVCLGATCVERHILR